MAAERWAASDGLSLGDAGNRGWSNGKREAQLLVLLIADTMRLGSVAAVLLIAAITLLC